MERKDLEKEPVHISLDAGVDETAVQTFVEEQCSGLPGEPQDAVITRVNGKFEITPEQSGMAVDVKATIEKLNEELGKETGAVSVEAVVTEQEPNIKKADLESISDVLGTCTTAYASSGAPFRQHCKRRVQDQRPCADAGGDLIRLRVHASVYH